MKARQRKEKQNRKNFIIPFFLFSHPTMFHVNFFRERIIKKKKKAIGIFIRHFSWLEFKWSSVSKLHVFKSLYYCVLTFKLKKMNKFEDFKKSSSQKLWIETDDVLAHAPSIKYHRKIAVNGMKEREKCSLNDIANLRGASNLKIMRLNAVIRCLSLQTKYFWTIF